MVHLATRVGLVNMVHIGSGLSLSSIFPRDRSDGKVTLLTFAAWRITASAFAYLFLLINQRGDSGINLYEV